MFVGHLAVALAAKRVEPRAPLGVLVGAAFGLDLLWPVLLMAGVERVRIDPGNTAFTPLAFDHYPWSHSLTMAVIWAVVVGRSSAAILRRGRAGVVIGALVLSHWLLDFLTHRPDLPLWPGGPMTGLGLWNSIPWTLVVEGVLYAGGIAIFARATTAHDAAGRWALWGLVAVTAAIWLSGPLSPPPPSATAVATVAAALWLFPLWAAWIERHRTLRGAIREGGPRESRAPAR
jgi:hypothetical protein